LLEKILHNKNIEYDISSVKTIARQANGSIRDLLSLTEQVIALTDNKLTNDNVESLLGTVSNYDLIKLISSVINNETDIALNKLKAMQANNIDFSLLLEQLLEVIHNLIVAQHLFITDENGFINFHKNLFDYIEINELEFILKSVSPELLQYYYQTVQIAYKDLEYMPDSYMVVEMALLRMMVFFSNFSSENISIQDKKHEKIEASKKKVLISPKEENKKSEPIFNQNIESSIDSNNFDWNNLVARLHLKGIEKQLMEHLEFLSFSENKIRLNLNKSMACLFTEPKKLSIEAKISNILKNKIKVDINITDGEISNSIAAKKSADFERKQQAAIEKVQNNPHVTELVNTFDAKVDINNIELLEDS